MTRTKKTFVQRCDKPLTSITRAALTGHLKHDRQAMAGLLVDYDPSLGNRASSLRKLTGATVICLVLGRSTKFRKSLLFRCGVSLTPESRASLMRHLKHDRQAMAGLLQDYDPSLGNRTRFLRKMTGDTVISLVLGRCYW